jgi:PhnB protein
MSIAQLNPYLNFDGTADPAIKLYQRALGAKVELLQRCGEAPGGDQMPEALKHRVLHAKITVGGVAIMISDTQPGDPPTIGTNVLLCLQCTDVETMQAQFAALAEGGKINLPLQQTFFSPMFGMLVDAYGISWMFNFVQGA